MGRLGLDGMKRYGSATAGNLSGAEEGGSDEARIY